MFLGRLEFFAVVVGVVRLVRDVPTVLSGWLSDRTPTPQDSAREGEVSTKRTVGPTPVSGTERPAGRPLDAGGADLSEH
jgi:hypothetical protein